MTPAEAALDYCRRGWSVIPLRSSGSTDDLKKPAIDSWREFQSFAADADQVVAWWSENPAYNVGILTGSISGLVVIDLDGPNAVALLTAKGYRIPSTTAVQTGHGYHAYFRHEGEAISNRARLLSDGRESAVDVRGEGGYVVAPPSRHGSGRVYQWARGLDSLCDLPPDLEELLLTGTVEGEEQPEKDAEWYETVSRGVTKGARNETAAKVAGYWLRLCGGNRLAAERATSLWNTLNQPPLPEDELKAVVKSVARRHDLHEKAEASRALPRHEVVDGAKWARQLADARPRRGEPVDMPGFDAVDGLVPGDLVVLAGRPGTGKSTYATQLSVYAALQRHIPTWIVSTEMTRNQWGHWMAAVVADCKYAELPRPLTREILEHFSCAPIGITDSGSMSIGELRALAEGRQGVKLIIVDHITRLSSGRKESRTLEIGEVARGLKSIAKDFDCTVVALCQLNRSIEGREIRRPRLADLRDSGEIEQEADSVMFLYSPTSDAPHDKEHRPVHMALEKNRFGPLKHYVLDFQLERRCFQLSEQSW